MLLEYFLSSGQSGSLTDTSISTQLAATTTATGIAGVNVEEFKNALNASIENRSKYLNNQIDTTYNESSLISNVQQWDQLYSNVDDTVNNLQNDIVEPLIIPTTTKIATTKLVAAKNSPEQIEQQNSQIQTGQMMPATGNELPEQLNIAVAAVPEQSTQTSDEISPISLPINPVMTSSGTAVGEQTTQKIVTDANTLVNIGSQKGETSKVTPAIQNNQIPMEKIQGVEANKSSPTVATAEIKVDKPQLVDTKAEAKLQVKQDNLPILDKDIPNSGIKKANEQVSSLLKSFEMNTPSTTNNPQLTSTKIIDPLVKEALISSKSASSPSTLPAPKGKVANPAVTTASSQVNEAIKLPVTAQNSDKSSIFTSKEQTNLNNQLLANAIEPLKTNTLANEVVNNNGAIKSEIKTFTESLKPESEGKQSDGSAINLKINSTTERFFKQNINDISLAKVLTNPALPIPVLQENTTTTRAADILSNEVVNTQIQQTTATTGQPIHRATEIALPVSLPTQQWNQKFAEHVSMLALRGATNAQIRLDPPELGPMMIRIQHHGNETQIQFMVNNPIARDLVDSGMQRLRDMMEQHGFENVNVDVNEFTKGDGQEQLSDNELLDQGIDQQNEEMTNQSELISENIKNNSLIDLFV